MATYQQGDYASARLLFEEAITNFRELGDKVALISNLEGFAAVIAAEGKPKQAARLYGAAEALREAIGVPLEPSGRAHYKRDVAAARALLDEAAWMAAWAAGRAMSFEDAVTFALEKDTMPPS
jgi:hypothetical protein